MKSPRRKRQRVQIGSFSSIGARLFFFMIAVVVIATGMNSFQAFQAFGEFFTTNYQKTASEDAEAAATQIKALVTSWQQNLKQAVGRNLNFDSPEVVLGVRQMVNSNPEFVSAQFFKISGNGVTALSKTITTTKTRDLRFEDKNPTKIFRDIEKEVRTEVNRRRKLLIRRPNETINLTPDIELPLAAIVTAVGNPSQNVIGVLTVWQSSLIQGLPRHRYMRSYVVDRRGRVVFSPTSGLLNFGKSVGKVDIVKNAWKTKSRTGFRDNYQSVDGETYSGAFAKVDSADALAVIVEYDSNMFLAMVRDSVSTTTLLFWASFIILAMAFSFWFAAQLKGDIAYLSAYTGRLSDGDFSHPARPRRRDELGILTDDMNDIAGGISKMINEQIEITAMEKEIQTAKFMKATLIPSGDILSKDLFVSGFYRPSAVFGGDLWGHIKLSEGRDLIFIGDAAGTGTQASIVVSMAYAACKAMESQVQANQLTPADILRQLNRVIYQSIKGSVCMTFFVGIFDLNDGQLTFANAGHNFPLLIPTDRKDVRVESNLVKMGIKGKESNLLTLHQSSVPVGIQSKPDYRNHILPLHPGDKYIFYSDGLVECQSPEGVAWGKKTLGDQLLDLAKLPASEVRDEIKRRAFRFFNNRPLDDDVTIVAAEIKRSWQPKPGQSPAFHNSSGYGAGGESAAYNIQPAIGVPLPEQDELQPVEKVAFQADPDSAHQADELSVADSQPIDQVAPPLPQADSSGASEEESSFDQLPAQIPSELQRELSASGIPLPKMDVASENSESEASFSPAHQAGEADEGSGFRIRTEDEAELDPENATAEPESQFDNGSDEPPIHDAIEVSDSDDIHRLSKELEPDDTPLPTPDNLAFANENTDTPSEPETVVDPVEGDHSEEDNPFRTEDILDSLATPPPPKMADDPPDWAESTHTMGSEEDTSDTLHEGPVQGPIPQSTSDSSSEEAEIPLDPPAPPMFSDPDPSSPEGSPENANTEADELPAAVQAQTPKKSPSKLQLGKTVSPSSPEADRPAPTAQVQQPKTKKTSRIKLPGK